MKVAIVMASVLLAISNPARLPAQAAPVSELQKVVEDYVRLYTGPTLGEWRALFHPAMIAVHPAEGGSIRVRNFDEFFGAQKRAFAAGSKMSERLENVRIEPGRRMARVSADFIFTDDEKPHRGKLGLHLAQGSEGWKIVAVIFSYDQP